MRKIILILVAINFVSEANEYTVPIEYELFMEGYEYNYPKYNCSVHWHPRTASFLVNGDPDNSNCDKISAEKMRNDAIKSIEFVKKQGSYKNFSEYFYKKELAKTPYSFQNAQLDAMKIWIKGCYDYKKGRITQKFAESYDIGNLGYLYPKIKDAISVTIYDSGWKIALANQSQLNCEEVAYYLLPDYLKSMGDIRKPF